MPGEKVLGPEWGNLAGLPAEKALEYVAKYAADLESKVGKPRSGGEKDDDDDDAPVVPNSLEVAAALNRQSRAPLGAEFVGKREAARREARSQVEKLGYDWNELEAIVENAMSGADATAQTNPQAWVAAFVYAYGQADITKRFQNHQSGKGNEPSPPRDDYDEEVVIDNSVSRGNRTAMNSGRPKIEDPTERNTKRAFEKVLGYRISDEEWVTLQDPDLVKTEDDFAELQANLKAKGGR